MNPVDPKPPAQTPIAIIGMGCLFPKAEDLGGFWSNIRNRVDAIGDVPETHWSAEDYYDPDPKAPDRTYARRGGFLSPVDFPPLDFGIAPNNLDATDTTQLLGLLVARRALEDAGYGEGSSKPLDRSRVSVILGVTGTLELVIPLGARLGHPIWRRALKASGVPHDQAEQVVQRIADSYVGWQENSFPGLLGNVAAGRIANRLDLGGTNCVIDAACASSVGAVNLAMLELAAGRCDVALTGGLDTFNDIFMYMCFSKTPALSPTGDARPFDAGCDGTILGEGLGILALKRLDDARRDGDTIYAVIRAVGSSSDGKGNAVYAPSAVGQSRALRHAYELAGTPPDTIELVEAHGTGTKVGDATELSALTEVYRSARPDGTWCALGSVKSQIGHTKAAAGAAGLIKAALALHHKVLPPTIKVTKPLEPLEPGQSPFYVNTEARPWLPRPGHPRRAAVSAFGFGGSNYHCVLEEADPAKPGIDWDGTTQILALSAESRAGLSAAITAFPRDLAWPELRERAALSRADFRHDAPHRLTLVVRREDDLKSLLEKAGATLGTKPVSPSPRDKFYVGEGPAPGKLAMLFPGQGSQYVGMLRELACLFPDVQDALAKADASHDEGRSVSDPIYPYPAFNDEGRDAQNVALRATETAQPAIGAVSVGLLRVLEHFGVTPDATAGHSFGELTALRAAGWIDDDAFAALANERGRLMAQQAASGKGAMLAVIAPADEIERILREEALLYVLANKNTPRQSVISGPSSDLERAVAAFTTRGVKTHVLNVSAAFHSPLVANASAPFLEALRAKPITPTATAVFANTTAGPYPTDSDQARALLAGQIARPVEFVAEIQAMAQAGVRVFLEVGPDSKLTSIVRAILDADAASTARAIAVDASRGERGNMADLASTLAELAAIGYPVDLSRWDNDPARPAPIRKPGLTVKLSGANVGPKRETAPASPIKSTPRPTAVSASPPIPSLQPQPTMTRMTESRLPPKSPVQANGHAPSTNGHPPKASPIASADPNLIAQALRSAQENLVALQRLSEQSADLHRQFLEGQNNAHRTFQTLLEQQQRLTLASLGSGVPAASVSLPEPMIPRAPAAVAAPVRVVTPAREIAPAPVKARAIEPPLARVSQAPARAPRAESVLLEVVAEKTGYPAEMLELDMQLDADLGIDSIKRVEILSALQERLPEAPAVTPEHLGTLRSLRDIVAFLDNGSPAHEVVPSKAAQGPATQAVLLDVVAEKTGYPVEMLELDMQLDADLGIDSIKRVEILSALQERLPEAPTVTPEHLGTLRSLRDIVAFLDSGSEPLDSKLLKVVEKASTQAVLIEVVAEKTGYPAEMLELDMQLDADLGIDSIKRVEILSALQERLPEAPTVTPEHLGTLRSLRDIAAFLGQKGETAARVPATPEPVSAPPEPPKNPPLHRLVVRAVDLPATGRGGSTVIRAGGEVWVTDDGAGLARALVARFVDLGYRARLFPWDAIPTGAAESRLDALVLLAPATGSTELNLNALRWVRAAGPALRSAGKAGSAALVSVSRLDGSFGLSGTDALSDPEAGGLAGLIKTAGQEWPEVRCKAVDLDPALGLSAETAARLADEVLTAGPTEVGLTRDGRRTLTLELSNIEQNAGVNPVGPGEVVVIIGGARGVTAEVAVALAEAFQPTLVLLGRSPVPSAEPDWLAPLPSENEIKRAIATRANGHATPQLVNEQFRHVSANREILATLRRIEQAGGKAIYRQVDVRDASAVATEFQSLRDNFGPIRCLIHGAGVLADRRIEDKTDAQFLDVYETKAAGFRSVLEATASDDLRFLVAFSSSTARFGRTGQADYASANEVLNKYAQRESQRRPDCRVLAVNWGPWDGGMVTSSHKPLFLSEGIDLIPLADGARYLVDELRHEAPDRPVEIVILGGHSRLDSIVAPTTVPGPTPAVPMSTVYTQALDVEELPILRSHVIDGRAVVPAALMLEWLVQGALQRNPGLAFHGVDDFAILKGAVLHADRSETVSVLVGKAAKERQEYRVAVELRGSLPGGKSVLHARGTVVLGNEPVTPEQRLFALDGLPAYGRTVRSVYHDVLFHGPDLHGLERIDACSPEGIRAWAKVAPAPSAWIERPLRRSWLTDPLVLDSAFQLMVLWCHEHTSGASLPTAVGRYRQYRAEFPGPRVQVLARVSRPSELRALADFELLDAEGALVAGIEGYECVIDPSLHAKFRRNRLAVPTPQTALGPR